MGVDQVGLCAVLIWHAAACAPTQHCSQDPHWGLGGGYAHLRCRSPPNGHGAPRTLKTDCRCIVRSAPVVLSAGAVMLERLEDISVCTHLVSQRLLRTEKMLCGLCKVPNIVTPEWLEDSYVRGPGPSLMALTRLLFLLAGGGWQLPGGGGDSGWNFCISNSVQNFVRNLLGGFVRVVTASAHCFSSAIIGSHT